MGKKTIYCDVCDQNVSLRRKQFEHKYHEILCLTMIVTFGMSYLILRYIKRKDTCPNCQTRFDLDNLPVPKL
ncbi:MAG: hypothetical protein ACFFAS_08180 [Promethearchaeota archaeon]